MATLKDNRLLFFTTSPRSPLKMIPEIKILADNFTDKKWNVKSQTEFMQLLIEDGCFNGEGSQENLDFSARDRINRAPKALGFVDLKPTINLTDAGATLLSAKRKEEVLLRQLLKFQLPSPYHTASDKGVTDFYVKPYLEIIRLINYFGSLTFDEVMLFGLQLTDYREFNKIVNMINEFRKEKVLRKGCYKELRKEYLDNLIETVYQDKIKIGKTKTRESSDKSLIKFISTKRRNLRDYTDACFRYLRATGIVNVSYRGKSISISHSFQKDVEYILENISRKPLFVDDTKKFKEYLFNPDIPALYTDNRKSIVNKLCELTQKNEEIFLKFSLLDLKDLLYDTLEKKKFELIARQTLDIKDYKEYDDIMNTFDDIENKNLLDIPLMLEWNVWRSMTMLDDGNIRANLKFDDDGKPMSTALGNVADIECDYKDFGLTVEVTMAGGQRQYETESEPVSRHLAKYKNLTKKPAYCLFIAPKISEACIAHFYTLHKVNVSYYGGTSIIIPIELRTFRKMVEDSYRASYRPNSYQIKSLFDYSSKLINNVENEVEWYSKITDRFLNWLEA